MLLTNKPSQAHLSSGHIPAHAPGWEKRLPVRAVEVSLKEEVESDSAEILEQKPDDKRIIGKGRIETV